MNKEWSEAYVTRVTRQRGGCLTLYLILLSVSLGIAFLLFLATFSDRFVGPDSAKFVMGASVLAYAVCIYGLWNWKRWSLLGYVLVSFGATMMQIPVGLAVPSDCIKAFFYVAILLWLVNSKLDYFD